MSERNASLPVTNIAANRLTAAVQAVERLFKCSLRQSVLTVSFAKVYTDNNIKKKRCQVKGKELLLFYETLHVCVLLFCTRPEVWFLVCLVLPAIAFSLHFGVFRIFKGFIIVKLLLEIIDLLVVTWH